MDSDARTWAMACHLSALVGTLGNGVGFILGPLIVWILKKDVDPFVDGHGKEAVNFQLTMLIAALACIPLCFVVIGFFLLPIVGILAIVLPIIAGLEANKGNIYRYPFCIRFIK